MKLKKRNRKSFYIGAGLLLLFAAWTTALNFIDVKAVGPMESSVGFASLNKLVHDVVGVRMSLYAITDWLGIVPICVAGGFGLLGLYQWIRRKNLLKVDGSLLALGVFYVIVMVAYLGFEIFVVNYRPILINGCLEASYPSSTTMLSMCVMPTAAMQIKERIRNRALKRFLTLIIFAFTIFMVVGRMISGVHWFSDIVGGALLSGSLVMLYHSALGAERK